MRATDLDVRRAMRTIARDELRHAALSWELAEWIASRLALSERALVAQGRAHALEELQAELRIEPPEPVRTGLGLPTRDEARGMLEGMRAHVWAPAA
jgi:hypothetical protein